MSARKRQIPPSRDAGAFTYRLIMSLGVLAWALWLFRFVHLLFS